MGELRQVARQEGPRWVAGMVVLFVGILVGLAGGTMDDPGLLAGGLVLFAAGGLLSGTNSRERAWWQGQSGLATRLQPPGWWPGEGPSWRAVLRVGPLVAASGLAFMATAGLVVGVRDGGWFGGPAGLGPAWGALLAATVVVWVGGMGLWLSVLLANRPARLVPPHLRSLPGLTDEGDLGRLAGLEGPRIATVARYAGKRPPACSAPLELDGRPVSHERIDRVMPAYLAATRHGAVFIGEFWQRDGWTAGGRIQRLDPDGALREAVAGDTPLEGVPVGRALAPVGLAVDAEGILYFTLPWQGCLARLEADGTVTVVAGRPASNPGWGAADDPFGWPTAVAIGPGGDVFVADDDRRCLSRVTAGGRVETVAGTGARASADDDGPGTAPGFTGPCELAVDPDGTVYVSDLEGHCVRRVDPDGRIETVAGTGVEGFAGDGGPSRRAQLFLPNGIALGPGGELYVADAGNARIRRIDAAGVITTVAGTGHTDGAGFGAPATPR